ncbi:IBR finger domain-containing protein [Fusarium circinatum]|uniref:IBR finger domain-containing protein n=1 Tax=Fusarium circinatum TaxID=48490 RepID=A0A8H5TB01_FUSCI|nr:IBR finger domain-containing protein [Fusarium circinatum]
MDARQEYDENASFEEALSAIVVRRSYEDSNQRDRQYEQTPEQHFGEEPNTQDDSSNDVANLEDEMDTDDEGDENMSDVLEDLSDGKSDSQPEDDEMSIDDEAEETSKGPSDSEQGEEIEQQGFHLAVPQGPTTQEPGQTEEKQYREKWTEHTTMNRTYCSNSQCLKFIPPNNTSDDGTPCYGEEVGCPACNDITCTKCKNKGHTGDCEQQVGPAQALVLAETKGWKRCLRCGHLIELADGCSHMSMSLNQLVNLSNVLTYASQISILLSNNTNLMRRRSLFQRSPMRTVLGSRLCCVTTTGRGWRTPAAVECVVREYTPTSVSVQPATFVAAMAAETELLRK